MKAKTVLNPNSKTHPQWAAAYIQQHVRSVSSNVTGQLHSKHVSDMNISEIYDFTPSAPPEDSHRSAI